MKRSLSFYILCLAGSACSLLYPAFSYAQVTARYDIDTVLIRKAQTFSNKLHLHNTASKTIKLFLDTRASNARSGYFTLPDTVTLAPGEDKQFPLKFLATSEIIKKAVQPFTVRYLSAGFAGASRSPAVTATFYTRMESDTRVLLQATESPVYLDPSTNQARVHIQCLNEGFFTQSFNISLYSYPEGLEITGYEDNVILTPKARHLFTYDLYNRRKKDQASDYILQLRATDDSGRIVATMEVPVESLSDHKQMITPGGITRSPMPNNAAGLYYINQNQNFSYYQLRANGRMKLSETDRFAYALTAEYYTRPTGVNLYDSWLAWNNEHFGVRAGNITDNLDYIILGRGAQLTARFDSTHAIDVFGVQNNFILASQVMKNLPGADIIAGRYTAGPQVTAPPMAGRPSGSFELSYLHARDPILGVYTNMAHTQWRLPLPGRQDLRLEGGLSHESLLDGTQGQYGAALGMRYTAAPGRWTIAMNNYASTPRYSGFRRGAVQLDDQVEYRLKEEDRVFLHYSKSDYSPKYARTIDTFSFTSFNYNNISIYEAGYRSRLHRLFVTLRPYYMQQSLYSTFIGTPISLSSSSARLAVDLNYSPGGHSIYVSTDYGSTNADSAGARTLHFSSWRITGSYFYRAWMFNFLVQDHPYYLTDQLQPGLGGVYRLYSFGPAAHWTWLDNRLDVNTGYNASYYSPLRTWTHSINAEVHYYLGNNWRAQAQVYHNLYRSKSFLESRPNTLTRVGVEKRFKAGNNGGLVHWDLHLFEDRNSNGIFDPGEQEAKGVVVRVDNTVTQSDEHGKVRYTGLTKGMHELVVEGTRLWTLQGSLSIPLLKNARTDIPLVQTGKLSGTIVVQKKKYETVEPLVEGIRIAARDQRGRSYSTLTGQKGDFYFYLPVGDYEVYVAASAEGIVAEKERTVTIQPGASADMQMVVQDRRREIRVRQF